MAGSSSRQATPEGTLSLPHSRLVSPPAYGYSVKREAPAALTVRASRSVGVVAEPFYLLTDGMEKREETIK